MSNYELWMIEGDYGSGKTLFMVMVASLIYESFNKVYANFKLKNIPNFEYIKDINEFSIGSLEENSLLCISEAHRYMDRREAIKPKNIKTTQKLQEIRKGKYFILADIFKIGMLDFRFTDITSLTIKALGSIDKEHIDSDYFPYFRYKIGIWIRELQDAFYLDSSLLINMTEFMTNYDTYEQIGKTRTLKNFGFKE